MKIGFLDLLQLLFIGLKLGNVITWSWWTVFIPAYIWIFTLIVVAVLATFAEPSKFNRKKW